MDDQQQAPNPLINSTPGAPEPAAPVDPAPVQPTDVASTIPVSGSEITPTAETPSQVPDLGDPVGDQASETGQSPDAAVVSDPSNSAAEDASANLYPPQPPETPAPSAGA